MKPHELSKNIKKLRVASGLSLSQLAKRVNTSASTLSRYESGWERFELYTLKKIATALGYHLDVEFKPIRTRRAPTSISGTIRRIQRLFWDHKLTKGDFIRYPIWITERVIEYGSLEDVQSLVNVMGKKSFLRYVAKSRFQSSKTERFWKLVLDREHITCTKKSFPRTAKAY